MNGMELRYCSQCGAKLDSTARFCSHCGGEQISSSEASVPLSRPGTPPYQQRPSDRAYSSLHEGSFGGPLAATIFFAIVAAVFSFVIPNEPSTDEEALGIAVIALLISVPYIIADCVLLFRWWAVLPPGWRQTTPGKAVGFCFIPFFNLYWYFIAYAGLAGDLNRFQSAQGRVESEAPTGLAVAYAVLSVLGWILGWVPLLSKFLAVATVFVLIPCALSITASCKAVVRLRPSFEHQEYSDGGG